MVKHIAYFPSQTARNAPPVLAAMIQGLRSHGIEAVQNSLDADAVIVWSVLWNGRMAANREVYHHYRNRQRPVVVVDVGSLCRGSTWKIALNHVNAQGHYGHQQDLDPDRPRRLGLALENLTHRRSEILIALQNHRSLQTDHDQSVWISDLIESVRSHTDRPIVIRPHPRSVLRQISLGPSITVQTPRLIPGTYDSFDINYDYHAVINHNSGPGIQAVLAGAPVMVHHTSLAYPVSITLQQIHDPPQRERESWLLEISHTEWLLEELAQGIWVPRIGLVS